MGNAAFVLIAVGVSVLASLGLWLYHRRPRTFMSSIDDFQREMKALSQEDGRPAPAPRRASARSGRGSRRAPPGEGD